jgi:hypothetical protein
LFDMSDQRGWFLLSSAYVLSEVHVNLPRLPASASVDWPLLRPKLQFVPDIVSFHWAAVLAPAKDRPILFTAAAWSDVLLTLDRTGFAELLGGEFYGLPILRPGDFLQRERAAGRLD